MSKAMLRKRLPVVLVTGLTLGGPITHAAETEEDAPVLELAGEPVRLQSNFQQGLKHLPVRRTQA